MDLLQQLAGAMFGGRAPIDPRFANQEARQARLQQMNAAPRGYAMPQRQSIYEDDPSIQRLPGQTMLNPQFQQSPHSEGPDIQGRPDWGGIPFQGSRGVSVHTLQQGYNPQVIRNSAPVAPRRKR